ncbi:hypothetical protein ACCO45_013845 [Purpureocillium lilacinum]|uniref:Uncharacterized protein n=1 Tax=Purpureocillium lilacinum TaxID=33203 RepID=A0ACC4D809_PURLI
MSFDMVQSLGDQSAGEILLDLDTESVSDDELHAEDVEDVSLDLLQAKDLSPFPADFFAHLAQDQPSPSFGADLGGPEKWLNIGMAMNMPWDSSAQGVDHHHDAQKHLKSALKGELGMNANYAEMLMAILGVGIVSVYYHGARVVKQLLLDAEYLIRSQGLPATKTFAHRVLHHLYTHLRVIMESTSIMSKSVASKDGEQWRLASQLVQTPMPSQFRVNAQNLGKLDSTHPKPEDVGYNDIHLDVSGIWQATLYPEIFGVPETLMTLLSQTISLVNERPRLQAASLNNPMVSAALSQHIKTLEQQIWSWSLQRSNAPFGPRPPQFLLDEAEAPVNRQQAESMILSMHQALIIFFYRRVYNISAMVIQDQVKKTLEFVQPCLEMERFDADFSVSISWSTFIAAAEAATPDLQELGLRCLEAVDDRGMFIERGKPSAMAKAVWEHRRRTNDFSYGWPDMMAVWNPQLRCSA